MCLQVYEWASRPRVESKFQYFAMNLAPIPILGPYTCFVAVNKQSKESPTWVAMDKIGKSAQLSLVNWAELPDNGGVDELTWLAEVAAIEFQGSVTDQKATRTHFNLLQTVREAGYYARSGSDFRILLDNRAGVSLARRRNILFVELSRDHRP
jgi:hypothetical protein